MKIVACYIRVSMVENDQAKQRREINHWLKSNRFSPKAVRWYIDKRARRNCVNRSWKGYKQTFSMVKSVRSLFGTLIDCLWQREKDWEFSSIGATSRFESSP